MKLKRNWFTNCSCIALACIFGLNGCASLSQKMKDTFASDDPCANSSRNTGILLGTVAGAGLGVLVQQLTHMKITGMGAAIGAGVGALAGGLIGSDMDRRRCELSKIAKKHNLQINVSEIFVQASDSDVQSNPSQTDQVVQVSDANPQPTPPQPDQLPQTSESNTQSIPGQTDQVVQVPESDTQSKSGEDAKKGDKAGLSVTLQDAEMGGHFPSGSAELLPKAQGYFREIADLYVVDKQVRVSPNAPPEQRKEVEDLNKRRVLFLGHTDDTGSSRVNADLSERRARAVAKVFMAAGVPNAQIFYQGAGETLPIADNRMEEGRAKNRRVEIVDLSNGETFQRYLNSRKPRVDYYRPVAPRRAAMVAVSVAQETTAQESKGQKSKAQERRSLDSKKTAKPAQPATENSPLEFDEIVAQPAKSQPSSLIGLDFGGGPAQSQDTVVAIGKIEVQRSITDIIVPSAHAAEDDVVTSCRNDRPRVAHGVKSLRDDREVSTGKYMPNLYNTSWVDTVNGHLVALTHVGVLRDGGAPARNPILLVYKNFGSNAGVDSSKIQADYRATPEVNTYRGENALLYRVFTEGSINCLDMVIPHADPREAKGSWLYYNHPGGVFVTGFKPHIAKTDK